jgi:hypothetical protein
MLRVNLGDSFDFFGVFFFLFTIRLIDNGLP